MYDYIIISLAGIALLTLICQWFAWWVKLPAILFLLLSGIIIGPQLGWLNPDVTFGQLLTPMIQLSVAIILFEGSLTLNFEEIQGMLKVVRNLVSIGILITTICTALLSYYLFHLPILVAFLFGALVSVTGPTVITPLLRTVRPTAQVSNILRWEGIIVDPIGALLAVLIFGFISAIHGTDNFQHIFLNFAEMMGVSSVLGIVIGYWLGIAIRNHWIPEFLHNVATLSLVVAVYAISNRIDDGSGLLTVTLMGIMLANIKDIHIEDILGFKESLSILLISGLFIILAARISFSNLHNLIWSALILLGALQFIVRPLNVLICTLGSDLNWRERFLLSWIAPRGIVAAAVSALFAIRLEKVHMHGYEHLVLLTFLVIIGTVVFQSITSKFIASVLRVREPDPKGFLIIGANPVARAIANALVKQGYRTLLTALNWDSVHAARMEGLDAYYGNPISEHADRHLDLIGLGRMLALTPQSDLNTLAAMRYKREFGRNNIFTISTKISDAEISKEIAATKHTGSILFNNDVTFVDLLNLLNQGAKIRSTTITKNFDFKSYEETHKDRAIPLFAIDPKERIHLFTSMNTPNVSEDWQVISLISEGMLNQPE